MTKYKLRVLEISPGTFGRIDWLTDLEIEALLRETGGTPISTSLASMLFLEASVDETGEIVPEIYALGVVGYARHLGYRIDIFPDLD